MPGHLCALTVCVMILAGSLRAETLRFCYDPYPPYTLGTEGIAEGGLKVALLDAVMDRIEGVSATVTLLPWKRCQCQTRAGSFDGILPLFKNAEREEYLAFSQAAFDEKSVLWHRSGQFDGTFEWTGEYEPFMSLRLGMLVGSYIDADMEAAFESNGGITRTRDVSSLMELLIKGRVDLVATDAEVGQYVLVTNGWQDAARFFKRPINSQESYFGLSKASGASKHIDAFDAAIGLLKDEGFIAQLMATDG